MPKGRNIAGVAFDAEGTIFSVDELHFAGFSFAAEQHNIAVTAQELLRLPGVIGAGDPAAIEIIKQAFNRPDIDTEKFREIKMIHYNSLLEPAKIELRAGWRSVYERLRDLEIPVAIASLTPAAQAEILFERTGLRKLIPDRFILLREDVTNVKPHPEVFLKAAERMGIDSKNMFVFGDSTKDMLAARAAGAIPVAIPYFHFPETHKALWEAGAAKLYQEWNEVDIDRLLEEIRTGAIS